MSNANIACSSGKSDILSRNIDGCLNMHERRSASSALRLKAVTSLKIVWEERAQSTSEATFCLSISFVNTNI